MLKLAAATCLFSLALVAPAGAQQLYLRNHPFKGKVSGTGQELQASVKDLAATMELPAHQVGSAWVVGSDPTDTSELKGVWVNGKSVASHEEDGETLVSVQEFAAAAGLRYDFNKALGTIDVSLGTTSRKAAAASSPAAFATPGKPIDLDKNTPGADLDVPGLAESGKITLILYYREGYKDAGYRSMFTKVEGLAKDPRALVYRINVGPNDSPFVKHYMADGYEVPHMVVFNRARQEITVFNGHSIFDATNDPTKYLDAIWNRR